MRKKQDNAFKTNEQKASMRITINSAMMGALFFMLTFILANGYEKFNFLVITQLFLAIPLLFVSVLAYSKIAYWKESKVWDLYGWITSNLGNIILLNAIGLMVIKISKGLSATYFVLTLFLMVIYSTINIVYAPFMTKQKLFKLLFFFVVMFIGGVLPLILAW
jgi:hypothetical protein